MPGQEPAEPAKDEPKGVTLASEGPTPGSGLTRWLNPDTPPEVVELIQRTERGIAWLRLLSDTRGHSHLHRNSKDTSKPFQALAIESCEVSHSLRRPRLYQLSHRPPVVLQSQAPAGHVHHGLMPHRPGVLLRHPPRLVATGRPRARRSAWKLTGLMLLQGRSQTVHL